MRRLVVIGAGLGGLSAAIRLAARGFSVIVLEKNARAGGKLDIWKEKGYTFDTGPTLLTMPSILEEFFRSMGERLEDTLELIRLDPICRYHYPDGAVLNAFSEPGRMEEEISRISPGDRENYRRFMTHAEKVYDAAAGPFLFSSFLSSDWRGMLQDLGKLGTLLRIDPFRTLNAAVSSYFHDPRLRQLFNRFATYNGSSPYLAPATLAVIPHVEFHMGGWYIRGGMYRLADALVSLATRLGVEVRTNVTVTRILERGGSAVGVETDILGDLPADGVIANADALYTRRHLLPAGMGQRGGAAPSLSGFVLMLGSTRGWRTTISSSLLTMRRSFRQWSSTSSRQLTRRFMWRSHARRIHVTPPVAQATCSCL